MNAYPVYESHRDADCFNCGAELLGRNPEETEYPPGRGKWRQYCERCDMRTFYDLRENEGRE